jgi:aminoglycoside 3-N-acetyltransferase
MQSKDNPSGPIHRLVTKAEIVNGLRNLGVRTGQTLLVHASVSAIGLVDGGPLTVANALIDAVGGAGNVVAPTFTQENSKTSRAYRERIKRMTGDEITAFHEQMPGFSNLSSAAARVSSPRSGVSGQFRLADGT